MRTTPAAAATRAVRRLRRTASVAAVAAVAVARAPRDGWCAARTTRAARTHHARQSRAARKAELARSSLGAATSRSIRAHTIMCPLVAHVRGAMATGGAVRAASGQGA